LKDGESGLKFKEGHEYMEYYKNIPIIRYDQHENGGTFHLSWVQPENSPIGYMSLKITSENVLFIYPESVSSLVAIRTPKTTGFLWAYENICRFMISLAPLYEVGDL
jgi:hypothetical protein